MLDLRGQTSLKHTWVVDENALLLSFFTEADDPFGSIIIELSKTKPFIDNMWGTARELFPDVDEADDFINYLNEFKVLSRTGVTTFYDDITPTAPPVSATNIDLRGQGSIKQAWDSDGTDLTIQFFDDEDALIDELVIEETKVRALLEPLKDVRSASLGEDDTSQIKTRNIFDKNKQELSSNFSGLEFNPPEEQPPFAVGVNISGTQQVGQTLTGNYLYGDVNGDLEGTSTFKWYRSDDSLGTNKTEILGATGETYTLINSDEGKFISFEVTPIAQTGDSPGAPVESDPTGAIEASEEAPTASSVFISGNQKEGFTLTGNYTYEDANNDPEGVSTYRWLRDDDGAGANKQAISGETGLTYILQPADVGKFIYFEVTPVAQTGVLVGDPVESTPTDAIAQNEAPVASSVQVSGVEKEGETLTGSYVYSDAEGDPEGVSTYKWFRADDGIGTNKTEISGATSLTYTLGVADVGKFISFEVTPVAQTGTLVGDPVESAPTGAIESDVFLNDLSTSFDGVNDRAVTPGAPTALLGSDITETISVFAWIKLDPAGDGSRRGIVSHWDPEADLRKWFLLVNPTGTLRIDLTSAGTSGTTRQYNGVTDLDTLGGGWIHVGFTYDAPSLTGKFYINGQPETANLGLSGNVTGFSAHSAPFEIGRTRFVGLDNWFHGLIDEVGVWNGVLSDSEVNDLYNVGDPFSLTSHTRSSDLAGWWRMGDGDTFPTISDQIGGNDLDMENMEAGDFVNDVSTFQNNSSILLDGVDELVSIPHNVVHDVTSEASVSLWVRGAPQGSFKVLASHWEGGGGQSWLIDTDGTNNDRLRVVLYDEFATLKKNYTTSIPVLDGEWRHVAFTWSSSTLKVYIDGLEDTGVAKTTDDALTDLNTSNEPIRLGARENAVSGPELFFAGNIDEFSFWNAGLSASDISDIYGGGTPKNLKLHSKSSNLIGWWRMGDGDTFPTIIDHTGNSDGAMINMEASDIVENAPTFQNNLSVLFDGVDDLALSNSTPTAILGSDIVNKLSVFAWVKTSSTGFNQGIVSHYEAPSNIKWALYLSGGKVTAVLSNDGTQDSGSTGQKNWQQTDGPIPLSEWNLIGFTFDGDTETVKVYLNGVEVPNTLIFDSGATINTLFNSPAKVRVGSFLGDSGERNFPGNIDEPCVFNAELSPTEISEIYNSGVPINLFRHSKADDLAAWWRMGDGDNFPVLLDRLGENNLTMTNMASGDIVEDTPSFNELSIAFDGTDDFVDVPANAQFDALSTEISASLWIKTTDSETFGPGIFGQWDHTTGSRRWQVRLQSGIPHFFVGDDGTSFVTFNPGVTVNDGKWHHVAVSWSGGSVPIIVIDGVQASVSDPGGIPSSLLSVSRRVHIGSNWDGTGPLEGSLDEVQAYSSALSVSQLQDIYNSGNPKEPTEPSLLGWWRMGDGDTFPTILDRSQNSNDGVMTNMDAGDIVSDPAQFDNNSIQFTGSNSDDLDISQSGGLDLTADITASIWFKTSSITDQMLMGIWTNAGTNKFLLQHDDNEDALVAAVTEDGITANGKVFADASANKNNRNNGKWHHVAMTWKSASPDGELLLYVDGELVPTSPVIDNPMTSLHSNASSPLTIGNFSPGFGNGPFNGNLSEASYWNVALTSAEIKEIYNNGKPTNLNLHSKFANLVGWWRLGESTSGTTEPDELGAHDGTYASTPNVSSDVPG